MLDGFLNVDKPTGITSHDVVVKLRKWTRIKRIGHTGTLDPDATGVLPLAIGKACRLIPYLPQDKTYLAQILLGQKTTTDDMSGTVVERADIDTAIDQGKIETALKKLIGDIAQVPPIYSAVHHKGQRLYKLARARSLQAGNLDTNSIGNLNTELANILADVKQRMVRIDRINLLDLQLPIITIRIACSAGTYIRSLARDLGEILGCGACLKYLRREKSGPFTIEQSCHLEMLEEEIKHDKLRELLINPAQVLDLRILEIDISTAVLISQGQTVKLESVCTDMPSQERVLLMYKQRYTEQEKQMPIAIAGITKNRMLKPEVVLADEKNFR